MIRLQSQNKNAHLITPIDSKKFNDYFTAASNETIGNAPANNCLAITYLKDFLSRFNLDGSFKCSRIKCDIIKFVSKLKRLRSEDIC